MSQARTLQTLIDEIAGHGARTAIVPLGEGEACTFAELADRARRLAAGLRADGLAAGEPVALLAPDRPEWVVAALALPAAGAAVVPLDILMAADDLAHALADSGCKRIFTTRERLAALEEALGGDVRLEVILLDAAEDAPEGRSWRALLAPEAGALPPVSPDDVAAIFYTSGTTGRPKGVPLTHANLRFNLEGLLASGLITPADRILVPLPLYHVYPFMAGMLAPLSAGAVIVFPAGLSGPQIVEALASERATAVVGVPRLYAALAEAIESGFEARGRLVGGIMKGLLGLARAARRRLGLNLGRVLFASLRRRIAPELRTLASGGAPLNEEVAWTLEGLGWEVLSGYGLTETSPIISFNSRGRSRIGTTGQVLEGLEVRIDGADETGTGEVLARGPSVFAGYLHDRQATEAAFTEDGWFRTGDLGRLDADGYLAIGARRSERIVLSDGKNVSPEEVEGVLAESPFVAEAAVLEDKGDLLAVLRPEVKAIREAGLADIDEAVRGAVREAGRRLAPYKRPTDVAVTREPLPKTPLGKLRRHQLAQTYREARAAAGARAARPLSPEDQRLLEAEPARRVWEWLKERYAARHPSLEADPRLDLGIDSLEWVSLSLRIEEDLGVRLTESMLAEVTTVRELLREVATAADGASASAPAERLTPEQMKWVTPTGRALAAGGYLFHWLLRLVYTVVFPLRADGQENVPADGPVILAPNHLSYLDSFAIAAALPYAQASRIYWAGIVSILFISAPRRLFSRMMHVFPVDPERGPASSLAFGTEVLRRGNILVWYPEGARSPDGALKRFLPGVGRVARETGARCLPVWIEGTYEAWPLHRSVPRPGRVRLRFGRPVAPASLEETGRGETPEERIAGALRERVAALGGASPDMCKERDGD